jgi:hypothetical protein
MTIKFQLNPDESILYHSSPPREWFALIWRIGLEFIEVVILMLFSITALTILGSNLLASILPVNVAEVVSRLIFQAIAPLLVTAWFAEDTARILFSELILTDQRLWTRGFPYAWNPGREMPLSDVKSMSSRRDALFIHLKSTRKIQVHMLPDGKQIAKAFTQFTRSTGSG